MKLCRKYGQKITMKAVESAKYALDGVLDQKKLRTYIQGLKEVKNQDKQDEQDEQELAARMASMQVEKK